VITIIPFKALSINGEGFHLTMKVHINGKPANIIIDTGASKTVFDKSRITKYIKNKTFDENEKLSSGLGTNTMKSHTTKIKKMKIGTLEILDYETVLLDLSHVNESYQQVGLKPIEGVLGSDILAEFNAIIDYEKQILKLKFKKKK
jgi:predicted aspartyl protease